VSILVELVKDIFGARRPIALNNSTHLKKVLNVGGGNKSIQIPDYYSGWKHDLLDIDPRGSPDIVCDARKLTTLPGGSYDAVYCSHNLEHYYRHQGLDVVKGFFHMLKSDGFAEIRVPDISQVIKALIDQNLELDDVLYQSLAGPITAHDVIYGFQTEIIGSGQDFYAHKTGFTPKSLVTILTEGGFRTVFISTDDHLAVYALAFKEEPTHEQHSYITNTWNSITRYSVSENEFISQRLTD